MKKLDISGHHRTLQLKLGPEGLFQTSLLETRVSVSHFPLFPSDYIEL